jgi:predicted ferric reductase
MKTSYWLVALYLSIIAFPVLVAAFWAPRIGDSFLWDVGKNFALMGFLLLTLQVVLAGRFKAVERTFKFAILIRFHRSMGLLAVVLLIGHPLLLALGGAGPDLLISFRLPWYFLVAKATLLLLIINVLLSLYWQRIRMKFKSWRLVHDLMAPAIIIMGFLHSRRVGADLRIPVLRWYWTIVFALALILFLYHRLIRPWRLIRQSSSSQPAAPASRS